ncbi:hypothetical protein E2C01_098737 [Portunus trituberculatus]|uniref:Uncharacterized protein n=1 Tax=Portunus trituberculatus TaxID=210409 RepID=A0A5B7K8G2_PORTR|nr:hypothetical protein [Portunus trituberculatus]
MRDVCRHGDATKQEEVNRKWELWAVVEEEEQVVVVVVVVVEVAEGQVGGASHNVDGKCEAAVRRGKN